MSANAAALKPISRTRATSTPVVNGQPELSVISSPRPRTSGSLTIVMILIGALSIIVISLGISTFMASNALGMGKLETELKVLQEENQAYTDQLNEMSSVKSLSERANGLGLVKNQQPAFVNLESGKIDRGRANR